MIEGYVLFKNNGKLPVYKCGLPVIETFDPDFASLLQIDLMQKFIRLIAEDDSVELVALTVDALDNLTKKLGPEFIHRNLDELTKIIVMILSRKIKCLGADIEDEEEE